ncbi:MAG: monovalent cation/H(+) antiporter subunit G [Archaeoglobi archaeon]|nr:monovalent cation/H(+) antiporter subunit G [Candidatus Mnemosynella bozhongmuii]
MNPLSAILIVLGLIFGFIGVLGVLRFPDFYTRMHASTICLTLTPILIIFGVIIEAILRGGMDNYVIAIHSFIALAALLVTNATSNHALARAAHRSGVELDVISVCDKLREKEGNLKEGE